MEKDIRTERQRCLYQHNQQWDLDYYWNELQLTILYLGLGQYYADSIVHGRVVLELELVNAEAILRVIGYLHPPRPKYFFSCSKYLFEERNKRELCNGAGEYVRTSLQVFWVPM